MSDGPATKRVRTEPVAAKGSTVQMLRTTIAEGPFSVLDSAMRDGTPVFIQCRFSKSLIATVVAFDKHFNLVLQDVSELTANANGEEKSRTIRNLFLRGESVIFIVKMKKD